MKSTLAREFSAGAGGDFQTVAGFCAEWGESAPEIEKEGGRTPLGLKAIMR